VQLPIGSESNYKGVVDLLKMKAVVWSGEELGADFDEIDIPENMLEQAELYRSELIDTLSTFDENILEKFVAEEPITAEDLRRALRHGTIENLCVPILNGTAFKNKGVQPLLDAVIDYMPSPVDLPPVVGETPKGQPAERKPSDNEPFAALAFKIMSDPHVGRLTYFRVYSARSTRAIRSSTPARAKKSVSAACSRCTPTRAKTSTVSTPATSSPASA
jgi:elongation factor G